MTDKVDVFIAIGKLNGEYYKYGYLQVGHEARLSPEHPRHIEMLTALGSLAMRAEQHGGLDDAEFVWSYTYTSTKNGVSIIDENEYIARIPYAPMGKTA